MSAVTVDMAEAHEGLVTRLMRLLKQAEAIAARRPQEPVSLAVGRIAADLLCDAARFGGARPGGLPVPGPDYPGLAAQLGQALAGLEAFEARHTLWDARLGAFAWRIGPSQVRPVARLRQPLAPVAVPNRREQHNQRERRNRMLAIKLEERFEQGFAAGQAAGPAGEG